MTAEFLTIMPPRIFSCLVVFTPRFETIFFARAQSPPLLPRHLFLAIRAPEEFALLISADG